MDYFVCFFLPGSCANEFPFVFPYQLFIGIFFVININCMVDVQPIRSGPFDFNHLFHPCNITYLKQKVKNIISNLID